MPADTAQEQYHSNFADAPDKPDFQQMQHKNSHNRP